MSEQSETGSEATYKVGQDNITPFGRRHAEVTGGRDVARSCPQRRVSSGLDFVLLGLVDLLVAVRRHVHRSGLAWPHGA